MTTRTFAALWVGAMGFCALACARGSGAADAAAGDAAKDGALVHAGAVWPDLPAKWDDAEALVARLTKRPIEGRLAELAPDIVVGRLERALEARTLVVGAGVDLWVATRVKRSDDAHRASYVVTGASHDSRIQVEWFRRLVGPAGPVAFSHVVVEQLLADGRWAHVDRERQRGDNAVLEAWLANPSARTLLSLETSQQQHDYAAWKFGYVDAMLDLIATSHGAGRTIVPCDMPQETQALLGAARDAWASRLRELHCSLALADALRVAPVSGSEGPQRIAAFWGAEHVAPDGFVRFVPREVDVTTLRLLGGRAFVHDVEDALAKRFAIAAPVLFAMDDAGRDVVVVLPEPATLRRVEVIRIRDPADHTRGVVEVGSRLRVDLRLDGRPFVVGAQRDSVPLGAGRHVAVLGRIPPLLVFDVVVPDDGWTELAIDGADVAVTIHVASGPGDGSGLRR